MTLFLTLSRAQLPLASSAAGRRAHDAAAVALDHSSSLAAAAARAVAVLPVTPHGHLPLLLPPPVCRLCAAIDATPVCRERARMREKWRAGCVARTAESTSTILAAAAPSALVAWPKTIDVPLSSPKRQNSSEKGRARSTRSAGGRQSPYRHLGPSEQPSRRPPIAPVVDWSRVALLYCRLPEKGTKLKPWGAAMIKNKTMGMMPRLGAIQWCRLRRDLPSRSLAPAMGTKGGGLATAILNSKVLDLT